MAIQIPTKTKNESKNKLCIKASLLDELPELIEEKVLGHLMKTSEKEKNISLSKVKKFLRG